ncbi:ABC transporter permease [Thalassotalea marina]|uniref:ABC transporter ATP-binding protein n=1 Tax=Thalassotalea marina TaxID=1673741 RepID=A0A919EKN7_9GAMM|nr:ABC transporter permease [Thalassotalea marina]GHF95705.1 ABC transporter ATP-binding protein [Thalassotalea marina]
MFSYYIKIALISIKRNWGLSSLMILAIALGIGATMTTVTVNYLMSADPIPHKSDQLYYVRLDSWDPNNPYNEGISPPAQMTYIDATNLLKAKKAYRQNLSSQAFGVIEPPNPDDLPLFVFGRANSSDFFAMFDVPFLFGSPWDENSDLSKEQVIVLSKQTNDRLFGGENSVGKTLRFESKVFKVVGVLDHYDPKPRYFDISTGAFDDPADFYVPFSLIAEQAVRRSGNTNCWKTFGDGFEAFLASECIWIAFWVELQNQDQVEAYQTFLDAYANEQKNFGRFPRPIDNRLTNVTDYMEEREVVADDARMMMAMSFMFLVVCLLNTVGLLLAKFIGKAPEIGLRQALGASRSTLFLQYIIESGCIGLAGGLLGLLFAYLGLQSVETLYGSYMQGLATLDFNMVVFAMVLALVSTVIAGIYPTWRACRIQPARQLKCQ